jgi:hypothetical protein
MAEDEADERHGQRALFADIDSDGDGALTEAELTAAHQAHMQAMQEAHKDMCGGKGEGKCIHGMKRA